MRYRVLGVNTYEGAARICNRYSLKMIDVSYLPLSTGSNSQFRVTIECNNRLFNQILPHLRKDEDVKYISGELG